MSIIFFGPCQRDKICFSPKAQAFAVFERQKFFFNQISCLPIWQAKKVSKDGKPKRSHCFEEISQTIGKTAHFFCIREMRTLGRVFFAPRAAPDGNGNERDVRTDRRTTAVFDFVSERWRGFFVLPKAVCPISGS